MSATTPVALVDDDDDLRAATAQLLGVAGHAVTPFADAASALAAIDRDFAGVVVSDVRMPGMSGIELFRTLRARDADLPVVLMTGHGDVAMAVDALKAGAWDFLTKPFDGDTLLAAVQRAGTARSLALDNRRLRAAAETSDDGALVGEAPAIRRLRAMIPALADADLDLVIEGETGTGKAHFARLVHRAGKRARQRFQTIDCATLPAVMIERELFARGGPVARAHRGTLLLDNLDRAPAALQDALARFAEQRLVAPEQREPDPVDVRIIAAIGEGGRAAVLPGLFHRIAGVPLRMPPLSERREDIPLLFALFAARAADRLHLPVPEPLDAAYRAADRDWPGNVRELEMAAERLVLGLDADPAPAAAAPSLPERLDAFERAAIVEAIEAAGGEMAAAIASLGLPRKTFYYRANRLGIDLSRVRQAASSRTRD